MSTSKRPPGNDGRRGDQSAFGSEQPDNAISAAAPQAIFVQHSQYAAIGVSTSRDRARVNVDVLVNSGGRWVAGGVSPSFPANLLDSVINALMQLRDRQGGGR